jgi:hypothetical protein
METREAEKIGYETTIHLFNEDLLYFKRRLNEVKAEAISLESKIDHALRQCAFLKNQIEKINKEG